MFKILVSICCMLCFFVQSDAQRIHPQRFTLKQEQLTQIPAPLSRLLAIYPGVYSSKPQENQGKASIHNQELVLIVTPILEGDKEGFWFYEEGFLRKLPFEPMTQSVSRIEKTGPNTFVKTRYAIPDQARFATGWADKSKLDHINKKELVRLPESCDIIFKEKQKGVFAADTCGLCARNLGMVAYVRLAYDLDIEGQCVLMLAYNQNKKPMGDPAPCVRHHRDISGQLRATLMKEYYAMKRQKAKEEKENLKAQRKKAQEALRQKGK